MANLPKELFDYGKRGEYREYRFKGHHGRETFYILSDKEYLSEEKCPIDGVNFIMGPGTSTCPCCNQSFSDIYTPEDFINQAKRRRHDLTKELQEVENIIYLSENPDMQIRQANLENRAYDDE